MAWWSRSGKAGADAPVLAVENLDVYYGHAHALQGVSFTLAKGVLGIVGRNGMGKTTLCNGVTGLLQGIGTVSGSVRFQGEEILGLGAHEITRRGIAYVPQGRGLFAGMSVSENLELGRLKRRARAPQTIL